MTQLDYDLTMVELICYPHVKLESKLGIDNAIANGDRDQRFDLFNLKCNPDATKEESKSLLAIVFDEIQKAKGELNATETVS
ncbi:hypothetical protein [Shouchella lehensis]|uniref:Uncharacterized protein n=1 Tax=Shouchella lehensis G1 TaxID=1246626 RepID=A0A060M4I1_9BACI|nr:hypothetical protein [Shouchella lehensis]AIC95453.1 hypothetical protein BleG1_2889 [Shouchella lehensis G1]